MNKVSYHNNYWFQFFSGWINKVRGIFIYGRLYLWSQTTWYETIAKHTFQLLIRGYIWLNNLKPTKSHIHKLKILSSNKDDGHTVKTPCLFLFHLSGQIFRFSESLPNHLLLQKKFRTFCKQSQLIMCLQITAEYPNLTLNNEKTLSSPSV